MNSSEYDAALRRGDELRDGGDLSAALVVYRDLVRQAPDRPEGHYKIGVVLDMQGDPGLAEAS